MNKNLSISMWHFYFFFQEKHCLFAGTKKKKKEKQELLSALPKLRLSICMLNFLCGLILGQVWATDKSFDCYLTQMFEIL